MTSTDQRPRCIDCAHGILARANRTDEIFCNHPQAPRAIDSGAIRPASWNRGRPSPDANLTDPTQIEQVRLGYGASFCGAQGSEFRAKHPAPTEQEPS